MIYHMNTFVIKRELIKAVRERRIYNTPWRTAYALKIRLYAVFAGQYVNTQFRIYGGYQNESLHTII